MAGSFLNTWNPWQVTARHARTVVGSTCLSRIFGGHVHRAFREFLTLVLKAIAKAFSGMPLTKLVVVCYCFYSWSLKKKIFFYYYFKDHRYLWEFSQTKSVVIALLLWFNSWPTAVHNPHIHTDHLLLVLCYEFIYIFSLFSLFSVWP